MNEFCERTWQQLRSTFPPSFRIYYSIKANPHQALLKFFMARGCGLEIASGGELQQALAAGCAPEALIYAGPGKTDAELTLAIEQACFRTACRIVGRSAAYRADCSDRWANAAPIALRVNPNLETAGGSLQMGGRPSQFGIDEDQLAEVVSATRR